MLLRYIERLRKRPPHERKRAAFFWAVGITGIMVVIWLVTLPSQLSSSLPPIGLSNEAGTDLTEVRDDTRDSLKDLTNIAGSLKEFQEAAQDDANKVPQEGAVNAAFPTTTEAVSATSGPATQKVIIATSSVAATSSAE